jgi:putative inorganic carbon (HCO3(-)) transporter
VTAVQQLSGRDARTAALAAGGCTLLVAAALGGSLTYGPLLTLGGLAGAAVVVFLLARVDVAALVVVAAAPFDGYLHKVSAHSVHALGGLLVASWLLHLVTHRRAVRLRTPVAGAALAMVGILLASAVVHQNGASGEEVLLRYLSFLGVLFVLLDITGDVLPPRRIATLFVAATGVAAICGLAAFFSSGDRAGGPVHDPNDFGFMLLSALPFAVLLRRGSRYRYAYDAAAVAIAVCMLGTLSRGALVGFGAMLVYGAATRLIRLRVVAAVVLACAAAIGIVAAVDPGKFDGSLHAKGQVAGNNAEARLSLWTVTAEMTYDYPVLGIGPGGFRDNYYRYLPFNAADPQHRLDVAHETYLETSSELGIPGLLAFGSVLGLGFAGARRRARAPGQWQVLGAATAVALVGSGVAAIFLTEQYYLPLWLFAALGGVLDPRRDRAA